MIQFRLSHCRSHYGARNLHEDWLKTLKVMTRIAHYPRRSANQLKVTFFFFLDKVTQLLLFFYYTQAVICIVFIKHKVCHVILIVCNIKTSFICQYQGQKTPSSSKSAVTVMKGKRSTLHTQSTSSDKANGKAESEENVKREEANKTESTGREIQQNIAPEPSVPDKSISSGTPEKPGSSDTYST